MLSIVLWREATRRVRMIHRFYIHEAGHMVVGYELGISGQVMGFGGPAGKAWSGFTSFSPETPPVDQAKRALGGLLAEAKLLPDLVPPSFRSVVFDSGYLSDKAVPADERDFLRGGEDDLVMAREQIKAVVGGAPKAILNKLREFEVEVGSLVSERADVIRVVAQDIEAWCRDLQSGESDKLMYDDELLSKVMEAL